ncbi:MAG: peptidylprolyl isomerase [Bacteroidia bacterium]|nr:peptidylprolyl isomerase [Bacteroidia bacterium]
MLKNKLYLSAFAFLFALNALAQTTYTYTGKPMFNINVKRAGTPIGNVVVELFPNIAPKHTRNFDSLVSKQFYDTTAFHRVIPGFMIQGGDPNSRHGAVSTWGFGQPGQPNVNAEFSKARHLRGILSAARSNNINSATSQFFICVAQASNLDGNYSVYGRVLSGINFVDTIVLAPRNAQDRPNLKHEMFITYLASNDTVPVAPQLLVPKIDSVGIDSASYLQLKWKSVSDAIIYHLDISVDSTFATTDFSLDLSTTSTFFNNMKGNTRYYWRVRTNNGGHFSPWSTTWRFHTFGETTGINAYALESKKIKVFPNPADGGFTFTELSPGSTLQIFNSEGKLVHQREVLEQTEIVRLHNSARGVYQFRIQLSGKEIGSGKLILR